MIDSFLKIKIFSRNCKSGIGMLLHFTKLGICQTQKWVNLLERFGIWNIFGRVACDEQECIFRWEENKIVTQGREIRN